MLMVLSAIVLSVAVSLTAQSTGRRGD